MSSSFLIIQGLSALAVLVMVAFAAWARIPKPTPKLDLDRARALFAEEFPDERIGGVWVAAGGASALARAGDKALILFQAGDGYVARDEAWATLGEGQRKGETLTLRLHDIGCDRASFALSAGAAWPPALEA
ncbi:MAG: hypothetical protein AB1429_11900 [Pseudomonadota bacterium]